MKQKNLVYSWTGNTAACAVALGEQLKAEVELILEQKEREGSSGFATGGFSASIGLSSKLKEKPQTEGVDVLLIGMPVWAGTTPPAINAFFLSTDSADCRRFFVRVGGVGGLCL